jgi:hypothetical protein
MEESEVMGRPGDGGVEGMAGNQDWWRQILVLSTVRSTMNSLRQMAKEFDSFV